MDEGPEMIRGDGMIVTVANVRTIFIPKLGGM